MSHEKKQAPLLPVYLINGEDELKRATVVGKLRKRIEAFGDLSFNSDTFNGEQASGADIVAACNTMPFASEVRLVQVNSADKLKKADAEAIVSYLQKPSTSTVLALVAGKLAKNTALYKAAAGHGASAVIDCTPQKRFELRKTVKGLAAEQGVVMGDGAVQTLIDLVGENTVRLDSEIRKIALAHRGSDAVNEHEVMGIVSRTAEAKPWEFIDAFSARDTKKCVRYFNRLGSSTPHSLLAQCVNRLRELICARALCERGCERDLARTLKLQDWRVKNHLAWARGFSKEELRRALIAARDTERAMKSGADPQEVFLEWVLATISK